MGYESHNAKCQARKSINISAHILQTKRNITTPINIQTFFGGKILRMWKILFHFNNSKHDDDVFCYINFEPSLMQVQCTNLICWIYSIVAWTTAQRSQTYDPPEMFVRSRNIFLYIFVHTRPMPHQTFLRTILWKKNCNIW